MRTVTAEKKKMSGIPDTLRSGLVGDVEPSETENAFMKRLLGLVMAMINRSVETAGKYTAHASRSVVMPADVHMALKYHARRFFSAESMDSLERTELQEMEDLIDSVQDSDKDSDKDSDDEAASGSDSSDLQWTRSNCTCDFCTHMHAIDEEWDSWSPEDPEEQFLKSSVEKTIAKTFSPV